MLESAKSYQFICDLRPYTQGRGKEVLIFQHKIIFQNYITTKAALKCSKASWSVEVSKSPWTMKWFYIQLQQFSKKNLCYDYRKHKKNQLKNYKTFVSLKYSKVEERNSQLKYFCLVAFCINLESQHLICKNTFGLHAYNAMHAETRRTLNKICLSRMMSLILTWC